MTPDGRITDGLEPATHTASPTETGVRVRAHPGLCEGWGNCRRFAPSVYALDSDGYIDIRDLDVPPEHARAAREGAGACPAQAISIIVAAAEHERRA